jgi:hypothetical protein
MTVVHTRAPGAEPTRPAVGADADGFPDEHDAVDRDDRDDSDDSDDRVVAPRATLAWLGAHLRRRRGALGVLVLCTVVGLAYTFLWGPVVRHQALWVVPGDIWSTFRNAHMIGWGNVGAIYDPDFGLLTFPAVVFVLTPVAMVSGHFGLTESIGMLTVTHPSAWLLLGPATLLLGGWCLLPFDALAEELGVDRAGRTLLLLAESVVVFVVVALWGHPEDMAALGLATYALLQGQRGRWTSAGWLWGAAIAFQPLVLVLVPVGVARCPAGRRLLTGVRALLPAVLLLALPVTTHWSMTTAAILHQGNRTDLDHPTPWIVFSARLGPNLVSAGPGRILALLAAVGIGVVAWRYRPSLWGLVWLGGLALALRCFFESVMVPFYLGPPFAVLLIAAAAAPGRWRPWIATGAMVGAFVLTFHRLGEWPYWLGMVAFLAVGLACGWPGPGAFHRAHRGDTADDAADKVADHAHARRPVAAPAGSR